MTKAFLFDFDGVVIDSEPTHTITKTIALNYFGIEYPPELFDMFKGTSEEKFFAYVSEKLDPQHRPVEQLAHKRQEILASYLSQIPILPGFYVFIDSLKYKQMETALVTSSTLQELVNIDKHLNITPFFGKIISADSTAKHKPDPAPYLKALEIMNLKAEEVIIIEDAPNGIIAGKRAGCTVYALTTNFAGQELFRAGADKVFDGYEQLMKCADVSRGC